MKVLINGEFGHHLTTGVVDAAEKSNEMRAENSYLDWQSWRQ